MFVSTTVKLDFRCLPLTLKFFGEPRDFKVSDLSSIIVMNVRFCTMENTFTYILGVSKSGSGILVYVTQSLLKLQRNLSTEVNNKVKEGKTGLYIQ